MFNIGQRVINQALGSGEVLEALPHDNWRVRLDEGTEIVFTGESLSPWTEEKVIPKPEPEGRPFEAPKGKRPFTKSDFTAVAKAAITPLRPIVEERKEMKVEDKKPQVETHICCPKCGAEMDDPDFCDGCMEDQITFIDAMRLSKTAQQATRNWAIWRKPYPYKPRTDSTPSLLNCESCGNLIWVDPWEQKNKIVTARYCSKRCAERS